MFFTTRKKMVEAMFKISRERCGYIGDTCDCKYLQDNEFSGEQTGCPESLSAAKIFAGMSDEEYDKLCKLANLLSFK